jgi:hypothetical protein
MQISCTEIYDRIVRCFILSSVRNLIITIFSPRENMCVIHRYIIIYREKFKKKYFIRYSRGSEFIPNTVPYHTVAYPTVPYRTLPYPTVPYRTLPFSVRIFITLAVSKREAYRTFSLKFSVFPLIKSKARTVPYLKLRPF